MYYIICLDPRGEPERSASRVRGGDVQRELECRIPRLHCPVSSWRFPDVFGDFCTSKSRPGFPYISVRAANLRAAMFCIGAWAGGKYGGLGTQCFTSALGRAARTVIVVLTTSVLKIPLSRFRTNQTSTSCARPPGTTYQLEIPPDSRLKCPESK